MTRWLAAAVTAAVVVGTAVATNKAEHYGISIGAPVHNGQVTFTEQVAADLVALGIRWIRVEFIAAGDTINYTQYDEIIGRANAHGLKVLGLLTYQTKWYSGNSGNWAQDWWQDQFRDRCVEVVNHYREFPGGGIQFWEVWNEPDSLGFMPAAQFGRLLAVCYPAIKAADPQAAVVLGGLTGYWTPTYTYMRDVYDSSYFVDFHASNGIYPFDIMGQHPYDWTADPEDYLDRYINGRAGLRFLMTLYGDAYKPIWFTEYGWNSSPGAHSSVNPGGDFEYNQWLQGDMFVRGFAITPTLDYADGYGPYAEKTFLFQYKDFELGTPETTEYFGTVNQQNERKHLYHRVAESTFGALHNLALEATVTASDELAPQEAAVLACDGSAFTKWTALAPWDDHTLTLDLNAWHRVHGFRLVHAEMGHELPSYNTAAFEIQTAPAASGPWTTVASVVNANLEPVNAITLAAPLTTRWVRLWITDAGQADGYARLPEFEVLGLPLDDPATVEVAVELGIEADDLSVPAAGDDLLAGATAVFESGDVDPANGVAAFELESTDCLVPEATPVPGFWSGYADSSPGAHVAALTDGVDDTGVVLRDFARASAVLRFDLAAPTDVRAITTYAYNGGRDTRVFQHYDVYVSQDGGSRFVPLRRGVRTSALGATNANTYAASRVALTRPASGTLAADVTNLRFVFYAVSNGGAFIDPWQGTFNEDAGIQALCDTFEVRDNDGYRRAFVATVLAEIDVFERLPGDGDSDGVVDVGDGQQLLDGLTGPDTGPVPTVLQTYDAAPRDDDLDLADFALVQSAVSE